MFFCFVPFSMFAVHGHFHSNNIAANLPNVCHLYGRIIAGYYENVHERQTWEMEQNQKNIWLWHPFHFGKIAGNS
jgi:hypothetical protein